jgi:hypothetical protein
MAGNGPLTFIKKAWLPLLIVVVVTDLADDGTVGSAEHRRAGRWQLDHLPDHGR